jgi:hypothetical protein
MRETDHSENLGTDGKIIIIWICKKFDGGDRDWIDPAQDKNRHSESGNEP